MTGNDAEQPEIPHDVVLRRPVTKPVRCAIPVSFLCNMKSTKIVISVVKTGNCFLLNQKYFTT